MSFTRQELPLMTKSEFREATAYVGLGSSLHRRAKCLRKIDDALEAYHNPIKKPRLFGLFAKRSSLIAQPNDKEKQLVELNKLITQAETDLKHEIKNLKDKGKSLSNLRGQIRDLRTNIEQNLNESPKRGYI